MAIGLDSFGITFLARELAGLIAGYTIQGVVLGDDKVLTIRLAGKRPPADLRFLHEVTLPLLCAAGPAKRSGHSTRKHAQPGLPRFEEHLVGCTVTDVCQIDLDRIIMITARGRADRILRLYFELMPPFPNLFMADGRDNLLEPLFKAGTRTKRRTLARGKAYVPPATGAKIHPVDIDDEQIGALAWQEDNEVLSRSILGVSPFLSREIVQRAKRLGSVFHALGEMLNTYRRGQATPCIFEVHPSISRNPPPIGLAWYTPSSGLAIRVNPVRSLNTAACRMLQEYLQVTEHERVKVAVVRSLSKEIRRLQKTIRQTKDAAGERDTADRYRKFGELLMANLTRIRKGAAEARVVDLYSAGRKEVMIPLERRLTPHANAEVYFRKAKKSERRAQLVEKRLEAARSTLDDLGGRLAEVGGPEVGTERLKEIGRLLLTTTGLERGMQGPVDDKAFRLGIKPRRYTVSGGWVVLVGRSAKENDILTHRYASPSDLWFHARQAQGSHVVLRRMRKKTEVSKEAVLQAAAIAAYHSKARTSKHVPVSYTEKRYVKRVRRGPPGLCLMLREKVVFVNPSLPARGAP
jgi:predicted ribosome quality control (RQC) complex YloA/Tae2 family protein